MVDETKKEEKASLIRNVAIGSASVETVNRYGSASAEYVKAYTGIDNELGKNLSRCHKKINNYSTPNEIAACQQAGFSAEVAVTANRNADNIIKGNENRFIRTDDMPVEFGNNHPVYDHVEIDSNGFVVPGSGSQMKFVKNSDRLLDKIAKGRDGGGNDLSRYLEAKLDLPTDQVEKAREHCTKQSQVLRQQADVLEAKGDTELANRKRTEAENYEKVRGNIRDSGITTKQARFYKEHPALATAMDIGKTSHGAGVEGAKCGVVIGGAISMVTNMIAVCQDDKELKQALLDTAVGAGKAAAVGYGTAFAGSVVKGLMQQSSIKCVRALSKTSLPSMVVAICLELADAVARYARGEIDGVEFLEVIGEKGSGMLAGGLGATLGQIAIPIPVVGGLIGGMVGYTLSSMLYGVSLTAFKEAKVARAEYLRTKALCEEARASMEAYRLQFRASFVAWLEKGRSELTECISKMDAAAGDGRMDDFALVAGDLAACMGKNLQFANKNEFDVFMTTDGDLVL
ncbi:hypothetical protein [Pararhodospirillum oryzae]|uniref:Uncharacterized protein n=1 Tax=Pararhodospirillum oryzae TaxID=478448 RepID=A0A512H4Z5_9PROT|nr:hypothetical protein [Pararhodospirillum oryzae]GEO80498.1 hypothetical protein ROR02_06290 [Pararhodospirillum oryzae]